MNVRVTVVSVLVVAAACAEPQVAQLELPVFELREEWRLRSSDSTPATQFTSISDGSIVLPDGRLLALDPDESVVRIYRGDASLETTFGRRGSGPREFLRPSVAGQMGDTIWIWDTLAQRYHLLDSAFAPLGYAASPARGGQYLGIMSGALIAVRSRDTLFVFDFNNQAIDSIAVPLELARYRIRLPGSGNERTLSSAFSPRTAIVRAPDGHNLLLAEPSDFWGGKPGQLSLRWISFPDRKLSERIVVSLPSARITRPMADSAIEAMMDSYAITSERSRADYKARAKTPGYTPAFASIALVTPTGIWLSLRENDSTVVVVNHDGTLSKEVRVSPRLSLIGAQGDAVWALEPGEEGPAPLIKFRMVPR
jgi:hypothetical protein